MSKIKVPCAEEDCGWESQEVAPDIAGMLLDAHIKIKHMPVQTTMATSPTMATLPGTLPQAERLKRPSLTSTGQTLEEEEFEHFQYLFDNF